jgi:hypothetical protein
MSHRPVSCAVSRNEPETTAKRANYVGTCREGVASKFVLSSMRMAAMPAIFFIAVPLFLIATPLRTNSVCVASFVPSRCDLLSAVLRSILGPPANPRGIRVKS